jgi:hypothetical protein
MSEIENPFVARNVIRVGDSRPGGWQSLRLVVHRNNSEWLTCGLIETSWAGASAFDARVAGLQTTWFPERNSAQDLRVYALSRALLALSQTQGQ